MRRQDGEGVFVKREREVRLVREDRGDEYGRERLGRDEVESCFGRDSDGQERSKS